MTSYQQVDPPEPVVVAASDGRWNGTLHAWILDGCTWSGQVRYRRSDSGRSEVEELVPAEFLQRDAAAFAEPSRSA